LETPLKDRLILPKKKGLNMTTIAHLTGLGSTPNTAESGKMSPADLQKQFQTSLTPQLGSSPFDNTTPKLESGSHKHHGIHPKVLYGTNDTQEK
jgi:hypothetical protein